MGQGDIQLHVRTDAFLVDAAVGQTVRDGHGDQVRMAAERQDDTAVKKERRMELSDSYGIT